MVLPFHLFFLTDSNDVVVILPVIPLSLSGFRAERTFLRLEFAKLKGGGIVYSA